MSTQTHETSELVLVFKKIFEELKIQVKSIYEDKEDNSYIEVVFLNGGQETMIDFCKKNGLEYLAENEKIALINSLPDELVESYLPRTENDETKKSRLILEHSNRMFAILKNLDLNLTKKIPQSRKKVLKGEVVLVSQPDNLLRRLDFYDKETRDKVCGAFLLYGLHAYPAQCADCRVLMVDLGQSTTKGLVQKQRFTAKDLAGPSLKEIQEVFTEIGVVRGDYKSSTTPKRNRVGTRYFSFPKLEQRSLVHQTFLEKFPSGDAELIGRFGVVIKCSDLPTKEPRADSPVVKKAAAEAPEIPQPQFLPLNELEKAVLQLLQKNRQPEIDWTKVLILPDNGQPTIVLPAEALQELSGGKITIKMEFLRKLAKKS